MNCDIINLHFCWEFPQYLYGGYDMANTNVSSSIKVKLTSSIKFKILMLVLASLLISVATLVIVSTVDFQKTLSSTNKSYLKNCAKAYGTLVTDMIAEEGQETVLGNYPGDSVMNAPLATSVAGKDSADNYARVLTLDSKAIATLKDAGKVSNDTLYVNLLIYTTSKSRSNFKYYSIGSAEKVDYMIVSSAAPAVSNLTSGVGYSTLAAAVAAAAANDTLQLNEDATVSGNRIESNVALTIIGKTGNEKILRDTKLDNITLLPKKALTLKNLVLDGQNINRKKPAIEASNDFVVLDNVTIQNYKRTDSDQKQGIITIKNKGKVNFTNCTFSNNEVLEGYGDVFMGLHKAITLAGNNTIPNGLYLEKDTFGIVDNGATHTVAIDLIVSDTHKVGEDYPIVYGATDSNKYNLIATGKDWSLAAGENFLYVKDNATSLNTINAIDAKAAKVVIDGKIYIRQGDKLFNVLGGKL